MPSLTEENYLKAIFALSEKEGADRISTNAIAARVNTAAASVTDMVKRLSDKNLVEYEKYKGVSLTAEGESIAKDLVRKHRLWEVFLMQKLGFAWDEVHEMAEDLEHVHHPKLIERLADFLGNPRFDPHGDPIPDRHGNIAYHKELYLNQLKSGDRGVIVAVEQDDAEFLRYLVRVGLVLNVEIEVLETEDYDGSCTLRIGRNKRSISEKVGEKLRVRKL